MLKTHKIEYKPSTPCKICGSGELFITNNGFLLNCSQCKRGFHHRCLKPPLRDEVLTSLLNNNKPGKGIWKWRCGECIKLNNNPTSRTQQPEVIIISDSESDGESNMHHTTNTRLCKEPEEGYRVDPPQGSRHALIPDDDRFRLSQAHQNSTSSWASSSSNIQSSNPFRSPSLPLNLLSNQKNKLSSSTTLSTTDPSPPPPSSRSTSSSTSCVPQTTSAFIPTPPGSSSHITSASPFCTTTHYPNNRILEPKKPAFNISRHHASSSKFCVLSSSCVSSASEPGSARRPRKAVRAREWSDLKSSSVGLTYRSKLRLVKIARGKRRHTPSRDHDDVIIKMEMQ
ncbi:hypothetical protein PNOK_0112100 [Pyrrhoderma noxium]|uniref:PHD-type domain-containing protein n=1 Tax=Pyrrhoderma noxium TaxID=2282107 RepID=A0A286UWS0_9AGAM|nr:hypothetical protein PNOK_0112100 [Pyrrhoderma noxium]